MAFHHAHRLHSGFPLLTVVASLGLITGVVSPALGAPETSNKAHWASVVAGGSGETCGIRTDGTLWCWGDNAQGQLGDGTTTNRATPVPVGGATTWSSVSPGGSHTCATRTDGTAWCWGSNTQGELGDGATTASLVPVRVGTASNWTTVSAGMTHTCGLRGGGVAWCWGANDFGKLGNGHHGRKHAESPVRVHTASIWTSLDAGDEHTCAIRTDQTAWCWGSNFNGQLGIGSSGRAQSSDVPAQVGTDTDWMALSAGYEVTCGIRAGDTAWCWGDNSSGQLGDGTQTMRTVATPVASKSRWTDIRPGGSHTCGVHANGTAWCWGSNDRGQIGDGGTTQHALPQQVGHATTWIVVDAGGTAYVNHTCGLRGTATATVWCWGANSDGQVGDGTTTDRLTPAKL